MFNTRWKIGKSLTAGSEMETGKWTKHPSHPRHSKCCKQRLRIIRVIGVVTKAPAFYKSLKFCLDPEITYGFEICINMFFESPSGYLT